MKTVNIGLLVGIAVVAMVGLSLFAFWGNAASASQYSTFAQAKVSGENVHIVGNWVMEDRAVNTPNLFTFYMQDTTSEVSQVKYLGTMPMGFKSGEKFSVQGEFDGNTFVADKIQMKCPSKYNKDEGAFETAAAR
jgi:cytochrome c-type biogenesis protein CcmE